METGLPKTPRGMAVSERLSLSKETQVYYFSVVVVVVVGGEYIYTLMRCVKVNKGFKGFKISVFLGCKMFDVVYHMYSMCKENMENIIIWWLDHMTLK